MTTDQKVRDFLRRLRAPAPEVMRAVFTRGGCYALSEILQSVFPGAEAWGSCRKDGKLDGGHVLTFFPFVGFFDIAGKHIVSTKWVGDVVQLGASMYRPMTPAECRKARKWAPVKWDQLVKP